MVDFIKVSEIICNCPILDICSTNGSPISILQWQSQANYNADRSRGIFLETDVYLKKSKEFISLAKETKAELVITPEYSFPNLVLNEIIETNTLWPDKGKLWALGIQGNSREGFFLNIEKWKDTSNVKVYDHAFNTLTQDDFVSALVYLFLDASEELVILPQFKIGSMADPRNDFEGPGLCRGNEIFVFDLSDTITSQNRFLSLICADVFYINSRQIIENVDGRNILLFHPQLNSSPRNENIVSFRKDFYRTEEKDVRIITLNCAEGTTVGQYSFNIPWSAFFKKQIYSLSDKKQRMNKQQNHKNGTGYIGDNHMEIWFSHRFEHCKLMTINKGDNGSSYSIVSHRDEPITDACFIFENRKWIKRNICMSNINTLLSRHNIQNPFPYPVCLGSTTCNQCSSSDYFYGSYLGTFEKGEVECNNELVGRLLVGSDHESDRLREDKLILIMELKQLLDSGSFPSALRYFNNNYKFEISEYFPLNGMDNFNLVPISSDIRDPEALVLITNLISETDVEMLVDNLSKKLHKRYRNQILVYYRSITGSGYKYFDKHLSDSRITNHNFSNNLASFKKTNTII